MKKILGVIVSVLFVVFVAFLNTRAGITVDYSILTLLLVIVLAGAIVLIAKIIPNPYLGVILLTCTLPFERFPTLNVGGMDLKINQVIAGLMIVGWILSAMFKKTKIRPNYLISLLLLYVVSMIVSASQAENFSRALQVTIFTLFMFSVSLVVTQLINSKEKLEKVVKYLLLTMLFIGIFGIYQFFGDMIGLPEKLTVLKEIYTKKIFGFPRIQAFSMEPLYYANFLFIPISIIIAFFLRKTDFKAKRIHLFLLLFLLLVNFILTLSRGAYLGLGILILGILIFQFKNLFSVRNIPYILVVVGISLISVFGILKVVSPTAYERFINQATLGDYGKTESTVMRLTSYQQAFEAWQEKPIFGIGPGNFGPYIQGYPAESQRDGWDTVNNEYLEIMTEQGIIGITIFLLIILSIYIRSILAFVKTKDQFIKTMLLATTFALSAILTQYMTFSTLYIMYIWFLIGLIIAIQNLAFIGDSKDD